jgi:acetyl-CoA carboxylase carboxyltransferase component
MKLRPAPACPSYLFEFDWIEAEFARMDALQALGVPFRELSAEEYEEREQAFIDEAELQILEEMTVEENEERLRKQAAANALTDIVASAQTTDASSFEAAREQSMHAQELAADPQAAALGLASLALTPRTLAQRPITARVSRGPADLI